MKTIKVVGFARVSTDQQDYERQISDLTNFCTQRNFELIGVISEKISGATKNEKRIGVQELLKRAKNKEFEKVVTTELSRLGRNAFEVQKIIEELIDLKISLIIQNLGIETLDAEGKRSPMIDLLVAITNQYSQMERSNLIQRINSGIKQAKKRGIHCGRASGTGETKEQTIKKYKGVIRDLEAGISQRKVAKINEVALATVVKVRRILKLNNVFNQ